MHKKLIILDTAQSDMDNIFKYISTDNLQAARKLIKLFYYTFEHITIFPNSGIKKPKYIKNNVMFFPVAKHYKVIYSLMQNTVYIHRVITDYQNYLN